MFSILKLRPSNDRWDQARLKNFFLTLFLKLLIFINRCSWSRFLPIFPILTLTSSKPNELHALQTASQILCASLCTYLRWVCKEIWSQNHVWPVPQIFWCPWECHIPREVQGGRDVGMRGRVCSDVCFPVSAADTRIVVPHAELRTLTDVYVRWLRSCSLLLERICK